MPDWLVLFGATSLGVALRIGLIGLLVLAAGWGLRLAARQTEKRLEKAHADPERAARLKTLVQAGRSTAYIVVLVVAGLMVLHTLSVNITPLLAGAGVAGLAVSLGAQTLIKDFIGGLLILIEDQFAVGDVIKTNDVSGAVERITLRATYLRDLEGQLHLVPNGEIRTVSNLTAEWARAVVDLNVGYEADMTAVLRALEAAAARAAADEAVKADLLEPPQALGWIGLGEWAVQARLMAKTLPGKQWGVTTALRRHALEALQAEGVPVALPVRRVQYDNLPGSSAPAGAPA